MPDDGRDPGEAATEGTAIHKYLFDCGNGIDYAEAFDRIPPEYQIRAAGIDVDSVLLPSPRLCEWAFIYDIHARSVEELGQLELRRYPEDLPDHKIPGTIDIISKADIVQVRDYKTGKRVDPPEKNDQLWFFGLCVILAWDIDECYLDICRIKEDGSHIIMGPHLFTRNDADEFADKLAINYRDRKDNLYRPGWYCRFCHARDNCLYRRK